MSYTIEYKGKIFKPSAQAVILASSLSTTKRMVNRWFLINPAVSLCAGIDKKTPIANY